VASQDSLWGLRYQQWLGQPICISWKKLSHKIKVKPEIPIFTLSSWQTSNQVKLRPYSYPCWIQSNSLNSAFHRTCWILLLKFGTHYSTSWRQTRGLKNIHVARVRWC
jgi:hypothetical protein